MAERTSEARALVWARIAGVAYVVIIALGVIVEGLASSALIVDGDPSATAANIEAHPFPFRASAFTVVVLYALVLVLALALYEVLRSVDRSLALLGLLFRSAEGIVGAATVLLSLVALQVLGPEAGSAIEPARRYAMAGALLDARAAGMDIVLVLVGIGGAVYCYLFYRSRYIPRWLAAWGVVTYLSMIVLATISLLFPDHPGWLEAVFYGPGTLFEVLIGLWLALRGIDAERWKARPSSVATTGGG